MTKEEKKKLAEITKIVEAAKVFVKALDKDGSCDAKLAPICNTCKALNKFRKVLNKYENL